MATDNQAEFTPGGSITRRDLPSPLPVTSERGRQNLFKRVGFAILAIVGMGGAAKVTYDATQAQPTPIVASKDKPSANSTPPASRDYNPTFIPHPELRLHSEDAEKIWKAFEQNPKEFMQKNPDLIVVNRQAGPNGLNIRKSPGADNDPRSSNFDFRLEPGTKISSLGIKIGHDEDGEWIITQTSDGKLRYFSLGSTVPTPPEQLTDAK